VIRFLADGPDRNIVGTAVVATFTVAADAGVKEGLCRFERIAGGVTNDAILGCRNVGSRLADSDVTVVAGHAVTGNPRVAEHRASKGRGIEVAVRTVLVVGIGGNVVNRFAGNDYIVMAIRAIRDNTRVIIGASGKGARGMAIPAVQGCRHMIRRFAARVDWSPGISMAGIATRGQDYRVGVVDAKCRREAFSVVASTTVGAGYRVRGYGGRLGGRVDTGGVIVARLAGLHRWVDHAVIENSAHIKAHDTVANAAVDSCDRMAARLSDSGNAVAGIAGDTGSRHVGTTVIRECTEKRRGRVAKSAFGRGHRMGARRRVVRGWRFAPGHGAVVATRTRPGYPGVIEATIRI